MGSGSGTERSAASMAATLVTASPAPAAAGSVARTGTRALPGTTTGAGTTTTATAPSTGVTLAPAARAGGLLPRMARIVAAIPAGRVATYGQVAALAGNPRAARQVAWALRAYAGRGLPWHRVVGAGAPGSTDGPNGSRTAGTSNSTGATAGPELGVGAHRTGNKRATGSAGGYSDAAGSTAGTRLVSLGGGQSHAGAPGGRRLTGGTAGADTATEDASVHRCGSVLGSPAPSADRGRARRPESPPPRHRWGAIRLPPGGGRERQRALLLREGVAVDAADRIDLARYQWGG